MMPIATFIFLLPLSNLIGIDTDHHIVKSKRNDRDDHVLPLRFPMHKDSQHQQSIANQKGFNQVFQVSSVDLTLFQLTTYVGMCHNE
jgi:hypothetical protein